MSEMCSQFRVVAGTNVRRHCRSFTTVRLTEVVQVPRTKFPTYLVTPLFPPPASFWSSSPVRGVFASLDMIHLCGPTFQEVSKDYPGADFIGAHTNFSAEDFARMVAKSAFVQPFLPWGSDHLSTLRSERSSSGPILALGTGWAPGGENTSMCRSSKLRP